MQCPHCHILPQGTWNFLPHPYLLAYRLFSMGAIWISSSTEVPMDGYLWVNVRYPLPESHLPFTRPVFPVLFGQGRNSCAPLEPQWMPSICLQLPECRNVPWMVHLFQLSAWGVGRGWAENWGGVKEAGLAVSPWLSWIRNVHDMGETS